MKTETVKLADLSPDPGNTRAHNQRNIEAIAASLRRFGQQKPIVIGRDNVVIAGNGTLEAARALEWKTLVCVRSKLTGAEAIAYGIADNRTAELADWETEALVASLAALEGEGIDAASLGFTDEELKHLSDAMTAPTDGEWADHFDADGDTSSVDGTRIMSFTLAEEDHAALVAHLKTYAPSHNEAIVKWLAASS